MQILDCFLHLGSPENKKKINCTLPPSPVLQIKDKVAAAQPAVTRQTPATEAAEEATTAKAMPGDVKGTIALNKMSLKLLHVAFLYVLFLYFILTEIPTPVAEPLASRHPRFLTPTRAKRNAKTRCPERASLPGVSSLKGAHCFCKYY